MKKFAILTAVIMLALVFVTSAQAAPLGGAINHSAFAAMGLQGMAPMSDAEGLQVRGKGFHRSIDIDIHSQSHISYGNITVINVTKFTDQTHTANVVGNVVNGNLYVRVY